DALTDPALLDLAEVEPGGEVRAFGGEHDCLDVVGKPAEIGLDAQNGPIVERIALFAAREPERAHRALALSLERGGQAWNGLVRRHSGSNLYQVHLSFYLRACSCDSHIHSPFVPAEAGTQGNRRGA